jgi:hypothetical protein
MLVFLHASIDQVDAMGWPYADTPEAHGSYE